MKKVHLTFILDGPIPAVTNQDIAEQCAEKLKNMEFIVSVEPEIDTSINEVNEEPISHTLETFKDIDDIITESDKSKHLGRPSTEQGGNRIKTSYNTDRDPFNE